MDVLLRDGSDQLGGKRIGLVTNVTGRTRGGQSTIDALHQDARWSLVALFSPEHGIRGEAAAGQSIDSSRDQQTGLPIFSLYGNTTRPTAAMLNGIDALMYDIQDVGARTYTYISTLLEVMRAAAEYAVKVLVLDRPDPIGGDQVEGNVLDARFASFVGPAPIAMRYGMTIGELAQLFNADINCDLQVIRMEGWQRSMWFDATGLEWVNPSPNIRTLGAAALYPGLVLVEGTNLSEGRGTARPFEWVGAPWVDAGAWAAQLNAAGLKGVRFTSLDQTPDNTASKYPNESCHGVAIEIADRPLLESTRVGVTILASTGAKLEFQTATFDGLAGTDQVRKAIETGISPTDIVNAWQPDLDKFRAARQQYLLYPVR